MSRGKIVDFPGVMPTARSETAIHIVSAFATDLGIVFGQKKVSGKSNEASAIPALKACAHSNKLEAANAFLGDAAMAMPTVCNLPDNLHRALRVRAAQHRHGTEAEVRETLASTVKPEARVRLGEALAALGRNIGLTNEGFEVFHQERGKTPAEPLRFQRSFSIPLSFPRR